MEPDAEQGCLGKARAFTIYCLDYYFNTASDEHILTIT